MSLLIKAAIDRAKEINKLSPSIALSAKLRGIEILLPPGLVFHRFF